MLVIELNGIECLIALLPHFHHEIVGIECVLSLLVGIGCKHGEHTVDADQLFEVAAV